MRTQFQLDPDPFPVSSRIHGTLMVKLTTLDARHLKKGCFEEKKITLETRFDIIQMP